ncbi:hypothetical protein Acid345_0052 [Candidatus Koribacter versatilis Ellin345]|uniref:Carboxypeptidase regulatory-like domain-containing protein n=1 Tax=Koribacter versatilis (strain Ellin345) TaxID=204669 RepID=Q1IVP3_KORVE|nr:carboxypeptidase-like regulatory domain-containing protein [Candidatus Koribacter versatilis]ABF39057.1 hypothetical protein Acid345_0052 [Candidatus Koribacter versatilis Ellin345]
MRWIVLMTMLFATLIAFAQQPVKIDHSLKRIQGVVQRENGEPIPNIDVEVYGGRSLVAATKTDSKGKFKADSLEPGEYEVWFLYKPRPVFHDAEYNVTVDAKGPKDAWVVVLKPL